MGVFLNSKFGIFQKYSGNIYIVMIVPTVLLKTNYLLPVLLINEAGKLWENTLEQPILRKTGILYDDKMMTELTLVVFLWSLLNFYYLLKFDHMGGFFNVQNKFDCYYLNIFEASLDKVMYTNAATQFQDNFL